MIPWKVGTHPSRRLFPALGMTTLVGWLLGQSVTLVPIQMIFS